MRVEQLRWDNCAENGVDELIGHYVHVQVVWPGESGV